MSKICIFLAIVIALYQLGAGTPVSNNIGLTAGKETPNGHEIVNGNFKERQIVENDDNVKSKNPHPPIPNDAVASEFRVLITGASGQLGPELAAALRDRLGRDNVITSDVCISQSDGPSCHLDVTDKAQYHEVVAKTKSNIIIHLAALLSATSEKNPALALAVNGRGVENALEVASANSVRIFIPSSIAAFGKTTPRNAPDETIMRPEFIYGVHKVYAEILGQWYARAKGLDFRSLRYPGVVSWKSPPGGGTTDWAVDSYWKAIRGERFDCFVASDTRMPMVYVDDLVRGTLDFIFADKAKLTRQVYNLPGVSFTPAEQVMSIKRHYPSFTTEYIPDFRQELALSWPQAIESEAAAKDWNWRCLFDLDAMTDEMIKNITPSS